MFLHGAFTFNPIKILNARTEVSTVAATTHGFKVTSALFTRSLYISSDKYSIFNILRYTLHVRRMRVMVTVFCYLGIVIINFVYLTEFIRAIFSQVTCMKSATFIICNDALNSILNQISPGQ